MYIAKSIFLLDAVENLNKQASGQRVIDGRVPVSDDHVIGSKKS